MACIKHALNLYRTVNVFTFGNILFCKRKVVNNAFGVSPLFEEVVTFKEGIVTKAGMGHDKSLHHNSVFFH